MSLASPLIPSDSSRQNTRERQSRVLAQVLEHKHVTVKLLSEMLGVSEATVRRDLKALADERQLTLVHGGATLPRDVDFSFQAKLGRNTEAKRIIGHLAVELIRDGEQVFLDSGTTCFEMAGPLNAKRGVSVVVNSARLAFELKGSGLTVILLGGQYRPDRMDAVGAIAQTSLDQLRGYRAFIGADGLSMDFGPSASDIESSHLYRLAIQNAREAVLLVDHTKFESASLFKIVDWDKIQKLVTDRRPSEEWMAFFQQRGIETIFPPDAGGQERGAR